MTSTPFHETKASVILDALRAFASALVLLNHWRNMMFVDYSFLADKQRWLAPAYVLTGAGHQAVIIFFVLSGYLVGGSVLRAIERSSWRWGRYLTHRIVRLWIVLFPSLILGLACDKLGIYFNSAPNLYSGVNFNHVTPAFVDTLNIPTFLGNVAFLQTILVKPFGSNGALWSLANEWWYYILFPLAATVVLRKCKNLLMTVLAILAVALFMGNEMLALFPAWLAGAILYVVPKTNVASKPTIFVTGIVYGLAFFGFSVLDHLNGKVGIFRLSTTIQDLGLAAVTFVFLWLILTQTEAHKNSLGTRFARNGAKFSYTLYLTHTPFLLLCTALLIHDSRFQPTPTKTCLAVAVLLSSTAYSWAIASLTEFRTDKVRCWVERQLRLNVETDYPLTSAQQPLASPTQN